MAISTIYLITGASRGIGLAMVKEICARFSDIKIIACVRNPASVPQLDAVADKYPGTIDVMKFYSADVDNNQAVAREVSEKYGRVDVLISNAGIYTYDGTATETPISILKDHLEINAIGSLVLFQAFASLLQASANPKFIPITTGVASSAFIHVPLGQTCYGGSKALLNFIARKIHFENEWLTCFPLAPGVIETDMSKATLARDPTGNMNETVKEMIVDAETGGRMLVDIIVESKRETHGGEFINLDGSKLPW